MNVVRSHLTILALLLTAAVITACGGTTSLSPVGPSSTSAGASTSATIGGSAAAAALALNGDSARLDAERHSGSGGDNRSGSGRDNQPGSDRDEHSGSGRDNQSGSGRDDHSGSGRDNREFQGRITSIDLVAKSLQIPGLTIATTSITVIRHGDRAVPFADLKVGDHVEARGTVAGTTLTATEIKVENAGDDDEDEPDDANETELRGVVANSAGQCPSVTFTIDTTKVTVNQDTTYRSTSCAVATANNARVEVQGTKQADGSVIATRVSLED